MVFRRPLHPVVVQGMKRKFVEGPLSPVVRPFVRNLCEREPIMGVQEQSAWCKCFDSSRLQGCKCSCPSPCRCLRAPMPLYAYHFNHCLKCMKLSVKQICTRMWADTQRDGRPARAVARILFQPRQRGEPGIWRSPQRGPGAEPLVRGRTWRSPSEAFH